MRLKKRESPTSRREMNAQEGDGSKRGSLPPKEGDLACMLHLSETTKNENAC